MTAAEKILRAHDLESWVSSYSLVELEAYLGQLSCCSNKLIFGVLSLLIISSSPIIPVWSIRSRIVGKSRIRDAETYMNLSLTWSLTLSCTIWCSTLLFVWSPFFTWQKIPRHDITEWLDVSYCAQIIAYSHHHYICLFQFYHGHSRHRCDWLRDPVSKNKFPHLLPDQ